MPTSYLKKLAKGNKKKLASLEKTWGEAKFSAEQTGHKDDYAYVTGTFNKMIGECLIGYLKS